MASSADWSSLPSDLVNRIAGCLLATNDVDYYMDFRAVCSTWRSATTDTKNNPDKRFHPSRWVLIDEVSSVDVEDRTRLLVNTATGRVLRKDLPMLPEYYIIVTTGGLFVLADKKPPHATCVLNPFTGYLLRFMAPMVTEKVAAAAVAGPTLILFCDSRRTMYTANVCSTCFDAYRNHQYYPFNKLGLLGVLYTGHDVRNKMFNLMGSFAVHPTEMLTIYPFEDVVDDYGARNTEGCFLVESAGQMLMIFKLQERMEVFKVDNDISTPQPVKSIGNRAIFLGYRQCLSVNADKFQMVEAVGNNLN